LPHQTLRIFLLLGVLLGACYALLLPPLQAPDEFAHFYRAYGITEGSCIAPRLTGIPLTIKEMAAAFQANLEEQRRIDFTYIRTYLHMPLNDAQQDGVTNEAADMYSCVPYLPSALAIEAGKLANAPPAVILYLSRFANLFTYLAIVYLALRLLPEFHIPLLAVALLPMALNQAASASWDGFAYGVAFLLFAYILKLAWDPNIRTLQPKHYAMLAGVIVLASLCKADVWLAPLLILVPAARFGSGRQKWLTIVGVIALALLVIASWNYVNREDMARWVDIIKARQIFISENAAFIVHNPLVFVETSLRTWGVHGRDFASEFVGKLGWLAVVLPAWCIWLYFLLLALVALTTSTRMTVSYRLVCLGVVAAAITSTFVGMWCAETTRAHTATVLQGIGLVPGVQGRYFVPFALPLLLAISCAAFKMDRRWLLGLAACTALTVNAAALQEIRKTYYQIGDMGPYENKLVKRNGSTPEDGKIFVVRGGRRHWIIFGSWVPKHGYRWDDLQILTPEQFNTIPEGKVISDQ
jgi:uncharacterized membrane protein